MQTRRSFLIASLAAASFGAVATSALAARMAVPIAPHDNIQILTATGKTPSMNDVKTAIVRGGLAHDWQITPDGDGKLVASINVRNKHFAKVNIVYSPTSYSVTYRESTNLEYTPGATPLIHPNYNRWVDTLIKDINGELRRL